MEGCGLGCLGPPGTPPCAAQPRRWDLSSKLEGVGDFNRPAPSCPLSVVLGMWAGEQHPGTGTGPARHTGRVTRIHSSTGMLQSQGDSVLHLPDAAWSCDAGGRISAAPGQGKRKDLHPPSRAHGSRAGGGGAVQAGCRQAAGKQQACRKAEVSLVWAGPSMI